MEHERNEGSVMTSASMNPAMRFVKIFYSPREVFASLTQSKWAWIIPILLTFAIGAASYPFLKEIIAEERVRGMENSPLFERVPESQKEEIFEQTRESVLHPPLWHWLVGIVMAFMPMLIAGGVMLLTANMILGGEVKFWMMLNAYAFAALVTIPESIVKIPLMISKESMDIRTSLALALPSDDTSFTYAFLNGIDIFALWMVSLTVIGMSVFMPNVSMKKIAVPIAIFWLIWVLIKSAMTHFLGGAFGF